MANDLELLSFQIKLGQATNKTTNEKFTTYKTVDKNGKTVKVIFPRKTVPLAPSTNCTVFAEKKNVNLVKRGNYRDLYINEIHHTEAIFQENLFTEQVQKEYLNVDEFF